MTEPRWLTLARHFVGVKEVAGPLHNPEIVKMWKDMKMSGIKDDETPWCAAFVSAVLENSGIRSTRSGAARSYSKWGTLIQQPVLGAIVVFSRSGGGGHVGFVVGEDKYGNLLVLGGNQSNEVNISAFPRTRVIGYAWPEHEPIWPTLPKLASVSISKSEA